MATRTSVRLATGKDFDRIIDVGAEAFLQDPVYSYFASLKEAIAQDRDSREKRNIWKWERFLVNLCAFTGGRITVIVEHEESESGSLGPERIVGVAQWLPPHKRLALWHVRTLVKAGIIGMLREWGLNGLLRCGFEWLDGTESTMLKGFRKRGLKNPEATWYLHQIAVLPECQGKGYMSKLIRESFDYAPSDSIFTLDATTAESRDKYARLGFEVVGVISLGKGKCNSRGLLAKGESAVGHDAYSMVRMPEQKEVSTCS